MGILNSGFQGNTQSMQGVQNAQMPNANGGMNLKAMLQQPQVKQQIKQLYKMFNGDINALMQFLIQKNPNLRNNQMLQMIMQNKNNPNGILGMLGLSSQDFNDIING